MENSELRKIKILANLTGEQLVARQIFGEFVAFTAGQKIVSQGERADAMFMLVSGNAAAFVKGEDGNESHLRSPEAGGHCGEIGLLEHGIRTASVGRKPIAACFGPGRIRFKPC